ncbi:MAG: GGDEF domain-containing phosphodiesterase, partial [Pseudomonadota bacterium]
ADDAAGAVAMLDVDDLSSLNVATGYDTGDRLLGTMEDVLRRALPEGLGFEKLESGRFVIWLPSPDLDQAASLVENLRKLAASSFVEVSSGPMSRPVSAGLAPTFAEAGRNRALVHVSSAVARAKALGGNRLEMDRGQPEAPALIGRAQIEAAVESGALDYYVQPIVDLSTDHVAGVEALLRWRQDDGDVVGPADFIHRLERLPDVSEDVFQDLACRTAHPFVTAPDPIFCTFNISGVILDGVGSAGCRWMRHLLDHIPPEHLVVEVVEYAVMARPDRTADLLTRLSAQGVRVALDDFGTGLSNLDRLKELPVTFLKLDRLFIQDIGRDTRCDIIVRNMIQLADDLGIKIIAEGVEQADQQKLLTEMGAHFGQGFHLGRPQPAGTWQQKLL